MKEYLGDGVYVDRDGHDQLILTTEDGIRATNTIYLDTHVMQSLIDYSKKVRRETSNS